VGGMLSANFLFSALVGKTVEKADIKAAAVLCKTSGLTRGEQWEAYQPFLSEEHTKQQTFMLQLMLSERYSMEEAMRAVMSRRTVANGIRLGRSEAAAAAANRLMLRADRPPGLIFEADGKDVRAVSVRTISTAAADDEDVRLYPMRHTAASAATAAAIKAAAAAAAAAGANDDDDDADDDDADSCQQIIRLKHLRRGDAGYAAVVFTALEREAASLHHSKLGASVIKVASLQLCTSHNAHPCQHL
jgi:hypothetical protein